MIKRGQSTAKKAVTLIELLVVMTIIGILATMGGMTFTNQRKAARNASRKQSLAGFQKGLEEYYGSAKTYMVYDSATCDFAAMKTALDTTNPPTPPQAVALNTGANTGCVGYKGQGWGAITRRKGATTNTSYSSTSIADMLSQKGYMQTIQTDPRTRNYTDNLVIDPQNYNDFLLTLCKRDGSRAFLPKDAKVYGLFANLENISETQTQKDQQQANHICGGNDTSTGGWNAVDPDNPL